MPDPNNAGLQVTVQNYVPGDSPWFAFTGSGFRASVQVSVWLTAPDGRTLSLRPDKIQSDARGKIYGFVQARQLDRPGEYALTADDGQSKYSVKFNFIENAANAVIESTGELVFSPNSGIGGTTFTGTAGGFRANEAVQGWIENRNGVFPLPESVQADANGNVRFTYSTSPGYPVGESGVSLYGSQSKRQTTGKFNVIVFTP